MNERNELLSYISDAHKDAYGFRPRGMGYNEMSLEDLRKEADFLSDEVGRAIERERAAEARCRRNWEKAVANAMELGATDVETATRWLLDAEGLLDECSPGYAQYSLGVGYDYNLRTCEVDPSRAHMKL